MRIPIIITRPIDQATRFADALRRAIGLDAELIIAPLQDIVPLHVVVDARGFVFTSANGVAQAARLSGQRGRAWCVGSRTADAARDAGFDAVNANGTAEDLINLIAQSPPDFPLCHVRGEHASGNISARLTALGVACSDVIAYRQQALQLPDHVRQIIEGAKPCVIPLFSPRSTTILLEQASPAPACTLIAISRAAALGRDMVIADRPDGTAMQNATIAAYRAIADT